VQNPRLVLPEVDFCRKGLERLIARKRPATMSVANNSMVTVPEADRLPPSLIWMANVPLRRRSPLGDNPELAAAVRSTPDWMITASTVLALLFPTSASSRPVSLPRCPERC